LTSFWGSGGQTSLYDPVTNAWSQTGTKYDTADEETWVKQADGTIVSVDNFAPVGSPHAEAYNPATGTWAATGTPPNLILHDNGFEIGPGLRLAKGKTFYIGSNGNTALYTPGIKAATPGTWPQARTSRWAWTSTAIHRSSMPMMRPLLWSRTAKYC